MEKPSLLRAAIVALLPDLARDPDRLRVWTDKGRVRCHLGDSLNFAQEYTLNVLISDFTSPPTVVFLALNRWLAEQQPDLLVPGGERGYRFEAEILDDKTFDIMVELDLTEDVLVTAREGGGWNIEHVAEPWPLFPDDLPLTDPAALLGEVWVEPYGPPGHRVL